MMEESRLGEDKCWKWQKTKKPDSQPISTLANDGGNARVDPIYVNGGGGQGNESPSRWWIDYGGVRKEIQLRR